MKKSACPAGCSAEPGLFLDCGDFDILKCAICSLYYMSPFPENAETRIIYESSKTFSKAIPNQNSGHRLFPFFEKLYARYGIDNRFIVKLCRKYTRKVGSVLDVGCSTGKLMAAFADSFPGAVIHGVDIDPDAKIKAPDRLRENIFIEDFLRFNGKYDIVVFKFVIEHLRNPAEYLKKAYGLLNPGGIVLIATPDITSPKALQLKQDWDLIREKNRDIGHIVWFDKKGLYRVAEKCNFKVSHWQRRGEVFYSLPHWLQNLLVNLLGRDVYRNRFIQSYPLRMTWALAFDCLFAEVFGYGESMYSVLSKPANAPVAFSG